jgi:hypothetical protein
MTTPHKDDNVARLVRIETKLDNVLTGHADHEKRIRVLERLLTVAAATGGIIATLKGMGQ